jgi:sulfonate transport system permease protein
MRPGESFGAALRTSHNTVRLVIAAIALLVIWEIVAHLLQPHLQFPDQVLPSIERTVSAFPKLSNYWRGGFGVRATEAGGPETIKGAALALVDNTLITGLRLTLGMALALIVGIGTGLLIGFSSFARRLAFGPANLLGMLPVLAMVPLFAFWFGATGRAEVLIIAFGAGITILRSTLNAVHNVPQMFVDTARTKGASRLMIYRTVIMPAIMPELRGGVRIALTFSWSLALGAELIGVQSGLGRMLILAARFSQVDRMILIAAVFVVLAAVTVIVFDRVADRMIQWAA